MQSLGDALTLIIKEGETFAKEPLLDLINKAKGHQEQFVKDMGDKLESYINKLSHGEIKHNEFSRLINDLVSKQTIKDSQISEHAKEEAGKVAQRIEDLVLNKLLSVIKR